MEKSTPPLPTPTPTPDACPRPAAPFALSMMLANKAAAGDGAADGAGAQPRCGKFVLPNVVLRKVGPQPIFSNFDDTAFSIKPPTQMMRFIDALRYHKPTDGERSDLNIGSANERLHLHDLNDLLVICGARKGFRFDSQDIAAFRTLSAQLDAHYERLDQMFQALALEVTRYKFANLKRIEDDPQFFRHTSSLHSSSACVAIEIPPPGFCQPSANEEEQKEAAIRWRAMMFQWRARQYVDAFAKLRETILGIRERFAQFTCARMLQLQTKDLGDAVEAEFEAKVHRPFPAFLFVLIQKYHREYREEDTQWTTASTEPPVDSIAQFALFISGILVHRAPLTVCEMRSMEVMLQVLKVTYRIDYELLTLELVDVWRGTVGQQEPQPPSPASSQQAPPHRSGALTNGVLSTLLYDFLATVRELRLVPRQKELLLPHTNPRRARRHGSNAKSAHRRAHRRPSH